MQQKSFHKIYRTIVMGMLVFFMIMGLGIPVSSADPLDPTSIQKYVDPMPIPSAMPRTAKVNQKGLKNIEYYEIAVRQFQQQVLSSVDIGGNQLPMTTIWSYGSVNHPGSFNYPAFTIEAKANKPVRVKWINGLVDAGGNYLPHLLPIDQTLHWANPPMGPDMAGMDPTPYTGPVPMVPHLHGAHVAQDSDGYPEAWFLPAAANIPEGDSPFGSRYQQFKGEAEAAYGQTWAPGTAVFQYPNDQRAATLWFHDHSLGLTRANVYAGPAGFYLLRGGPSDEVMDRTTGLPAVLPGPAPALGDPPGMTYYEIPLVIQDKSFNADGSLFYPADRAFFEGLEPSQLQIPFIPELTLDGAPSDISPIWNPEFFGNTMVVNGKTWPYLNVEPRRYRFRILNASDSRFYILKMSNDQPFWTIGNDGGFLSEPVMVGMLLIAPAERADVIIDFTGLPVDTRIILKNLGPDEPFGGGVPGEDFDAADPDTTGQMMEFRVVSLTGPDYSTPPDNMVLPAIAPIAGTPVTRRLSLNELMSDTVFIPVDENGDPLLNAEGNLVAVPEGTPSSDMFGPAKAQLGTMGDSGPIPNPWMADITENPPLNQTEIWELNNFTADAHPIHLHQIQFEVIEREFMGQISPPEPWETGFKDTVIAYPGDEGDNPGITRVKVKFDIEGLFVWHCHILSHEDNEMMRPICVGGDCAPMP